MISFCFMTDVWCSCFGVYGFGCFLLPYGCVQCACVVVLACVEWLVPIFFRLAILFVSHG